MFNEEKGITLVALVVTIIVLLILAGVTITLVVGQNGLIGRAQNASNTMANATANEQHALNDATREYDSQYQQYVTGYSVPGTGN